MSSKLFPLLILALLAHGPEAVADSVEISSGGNLTGKVIRTADYVLVQVDDEIQVAIPNSRVRSVVMSDELTEYQSLVEKAGEDAELHYQLARWCSAGNNLPGRKEHYKRRHMQRAVELDPQHAQARAWLGFKQHEGKWIRTSDLMRDRGMISVGGKWDLPEAVALSDTRDSIHKDAKAWVQDVNRLVGVALRSSTRADKAQEALAALEAINDPLAAEAIARQLEESRGKRTQSVAMRRMWINLLGRFRNPVSIEALIRTGIEEPDQGIREAAMEQLVLYGSASAVATYTPMLRAGDSGLVNRAARALSWFPDPESAMIYVDALKTTEKSTGPPPPGMQAGFGDNGVNGLAMGGQPTTRTETKTNPAVLGLLKQVEPDVDFGYDQNRWLAYLAAKKTTFSGDLRRDP